MQRLIIIFFLPLIISCSNKVGVIISWRDYNVNGNVKMLSDNIVFAKYDNNWEISLDTSLVNLNIIQNRYFNKNGLLCEFDYFDKDSILTLKNKYTLSSKGEIIGANIFKNGEKKEKLVIQSVNDNLFEAKTYIIDSNELTSTSLTYRINGFTDKQLNLSKLSGRINKSAKYYYRNKIGFVTEIIDTVKIDEQEFTNRTFVKYVESDKNANWTKKIEYSNDNENRCKVTIRRLIYY